MQVLSSTFELPIDVEGRAMSGDADFGGDAQMRDRYEQAIREAEVSNVPLNKRVLRADDFLPEKEWKVLASVGYMCDDPYTGTTGVSQIGDRLYRVTTRLATRKASSRITFTLRLMESLEQSRQVFSPLLVRFLNGVDYTRRPVKISDSGRIRNELQTMLSQALEHNGETIRVHFDRIDPQVLPLEKQSRIGDILRWYKQEHPVWFEWLEIA